MMVGVVLSVHPATVVAAMTIFYSLLGVSLFVPFLGGLYTRRAGSPEALWAIAAGVMTLLIVRFRLSAQHPWLDPTAAGLAASGLAFVLVLAIRGPK